MLQSSNFGLDLASTQPYLEIRLTELRGFSLLESQAVCLPALCKVYSIHPIHLPLCSTHLLQNHWYMRLLSPAPGHRPSQGRLPGQCTSGSTRHTPRPSPAPTSNPRPTSHWMQAIPRPSGTAAPPPLCRYRLPPGGRGAAC